MTDTSLCGRCGAMLPMPDTEGRVSCLSCGRTMKVSAPVGPMNFGSSPQAFTGSSPVPPPKQPGPGYAVRPLVRSRKPSWARRMIIRILVALFVLGLATTLLRDGSDDASAPAEPELTSSAGSTVLLPSVGSTTERLSVVFDTESRRHVVARYDTAAQAPDGGELIWRSEPLPRDGRDVSYAIDGNDLYVATQSAVWKLDVTTGLRQWERQLPDLVPRGCADCFSVIDGQLVAQTIDGNVVALSPTTGEELWRRRFEDPGGAVTVANGYLLVVDKSAEADAATVYWLDPATGSEQSGQVLRCEFDDSPLDPAAGVSTKVFAVPESDDVVAFFGFGCIMRWSVETNEIEWQRPWELGPQTYGSRPVLSPSHMVVADAGGNAVVVDLDDGDLRPLEPVADQRLVPWRIDGTTVVAGTESQRGTAKAGLAAWDAETGRQTWVQTSSDSSSLVDDTVFAANLTSGQVQWILVKPDDEQDDDQPTVVAVDPEAHTATIDTIDPATGETVRSVEVGYRYNSGSLAEGWVSVEDQRDGVIALQLENLLQVIDLRSGELVGWRAWQPD